jgi:hypothetical protein
MSTGQIFLLNYKLLYIPPNRPCSILNTSQWEASGQSQVVPETFITFSELTWPMAENILSILFFGRTVFAIV